LEHFVGLGCRTRHRTGLLGRFQSQCLKPVSQRKQMLAITSQFASQLCGWRPLADATQDQHQLDRRAVCLLEWGARVGIEHGPAMTAAVVEYGRTMTIVNGQGIVPSASGAVQSVGVQHVDQELVAGVVVHQLEDWEVHPWTLQEQGHWGRKGNHFHNLKTGRFTPDAS
jgi:hypothetical protein